MLRIHSQSPESGYHCESRHWRPEFRLIVVGRLPLFLFPPANNHDERGHPKGCDTEAQRYRNAAEVAAAIRLSWAASELRSLRFSVASSSPHLDPSIRDSCI